MSILFVHCSYDIHPNVESTCETSFQWYTCSTRSNCWYWTSERVTNAGIKSLLILSSSWAFVFAIFFYYEYIVTCFTVSFRSFYFLTVVVCFLLSFQFFFSCGSETKTVFNCVIVPIYGLFAFLFQVTFHFWRNICDLDSFFNLYEALRSSSFRPSAMRVVFQGNYSRKYCSFDLMISDGNSSRSIIISVINCDVLFFDYDDKLKVSTNHRWLKCRRSSLVESRANEFSLEESIFYLKLILFEHFFYDCVIIS